MTRTKFHDVIVTMMEAQEESGLVVEAMTAIRTISDGGHGWHWKTADERLSAINVISDLMHNFAIGDPVRLKIVRSQFEMQFSRSPEAFELCPALVSWAQNGAAKA